MLKLLKDWYNGEFVVEPEEPGSMLMPLMYTRYHWTARIVRMLAAFYLQHWQWVWGTAIGVASLWVAVLSLKP